MNDQDMRDNPAASRVLVVDDDEKNRRLLRDLLSVHGYPVTEAVDGEDALRQVAETPPDVILMDVMMPKLDGFDTCRKLQSDARTAPIPVLLVTALHERADRLRGIASGAIDFITKPIDTAEVLLRVRNVLRAKHLYDQRNELLRMRETLSDMIVHDIRNPLLAITLSARRLEKPCDPAAVPQLAGTILEQVQFIEHFVADLLTVSKMEQGHLPLQRARENLAELGRSALRKHQLLAESKDIRLELAAPDAPCLAEVDKSLFGRLLDNLLGNAIKFAPKGSPVILRITPAGASGTACRIRVEDEGPGIPISYRETIFDKFKILQSKDPELPQTGLGLALCRMVAEAHGGRIYVEPRQPCGSAFTVELP
jgi:signal transduction histidine kinase